MKFKPLCPEICNIIGGYLERKIISKPPILYLNQFNVHSVYCRDFLNKCKLALISSISSTVGRFVDFVIFVFFSYSTFLEEYRAVN